MTKVWRERLHTGGWIGFGVLLIGALIWSLLQHGEGRPRAIDKVTSLALLSPPPPPPPPPPKKIVPQRVAKAPPTLTAPKSPAPAVDKPLAMDTPVDSNPYQIPQAAAEGAAVSGGGNGGNGVFTIGGGGGEGGCSGVIGKSFLDLINSQMMHAFENSKKTDNRHFQIQAQLWFDPSGKVKQSELVDSTGDASLDAAITQVLSEVDLGENVPSCMQSVSIRVKEPWTGSFADASDKQTQSAKHEQSETLIWRQSVRR